jgi:putative acetyltransferase
MHYLRGIEPATYPSPRRSLRRANARAHRAPPRRHARALAAGKRARLRPGRAASDVTLWSAWVGEDLAGCGALKHLDDERAEIKSMRVVDAFLGRGIGRAILLFIIDQARARGVRSLWLETGSAEAFMPALRLYESAAFTRCGPFDGYVEDPFSIFMMREL